MHTHTHTHSCCVLNISHPCLLLLSLLHLCGTAVIIFDIRQKHLTRFQLMSFCCDGRMRKRGWWGGEGAEVAVSVSVFLLGLLQMVGRTARFSGRSRQPPGRMQTSLSSFRKEIYLHKYVCAARMFELNSDFLLSVLGPGWFSQFADESIKMCPPCLLGLDKQVDLQQKNKLAMCQRTGEGKKRPWS